MKLRVAYEKEIVTRSIIINSSRKVLTSLHVLLWYNKLSISWTSSHSYYQQSSEIQLKSAKGGPCCSEECKLDGWIVSRSCQCSLAHVCGIKSLYLRNICLTRVRKCKQNPLNTGSRNKVFCSTVRLNLTDPLKRNLTFRNLELKFYGKCL